MGKFILCTGRAAQKPYHFALTGAEVYSIEELCYYLYHNIYSITEEDFNRTMADWLRIEAGMEEMADKLERLLQNKNSVKDIVVSLLCSADYYTEPEIKELLRLMGELERLPAWKRLKIKGDHYVKYRNYTAAITLYDSILKGEEVRLSPAEFGGILHNRSVACMHTASFLEAAEGFLKAYAGNQNPESLREYLAALYLGKNEETFVTEAEKYGVSEEEREKLLEEIKIRQMEAEELAIYRQLEKIQELKREGRVSEYYTGLEGLILKWKQEYRKEIGNCSYAYKES